MSIFGDVGRDVDPRGPITLSPRAASDGDDAAATDGELGAGGLNASFFVSLGASVGELADGLAADRARRDARQIPGDASLFGSVTIPTGGTSGTVDLGSVPLGRVWQIRRLILGGAKVTSTPAGVGYAFAQGAPPTDLGITNCVDIFTTFPQGNTYGTHQLFLLPSEHLYVVFSGATAGTQYSAAARIEDWAQDDFFSTYVE